MLPMTPFSKGAGDRGEHWKVVPSSMQLNQSKMPAGLGLNVLHQENPILLNSVLISHQDRLRQN